MIILMSCSKDEPNFVGVFNLSELQLQCPTNSNSYEDGINGVCVPGSDNSQTCFEWEFDIMLDGTFMESTITHSISGNLALSRPNKKEGTYTTSENQIVLTYPEGTSIELSMNDSETAISGYIVGTTDSGCEIFSIFSRN